MFGEALGAARDGREASGRRGAPRARPSEEESLLQLLFYGF